jgi:hypothetical protein
MPDTTHITALLSRSHAAVLAAANAVPGEAWRTLPSPGAWSAAEVFAHLTMVEEAITGGVAKMLGAPPKPLTFWKRIHLSPRMAQFRQIKRQSPIPLDPALVLDKPESLARHIALRKRALELLAENSGRDLAAYRYKHPFFGYLNFYQWFATIGYHELRHTQQIQEIVGVFQK